ncbi:hypothetical protein PQC40_gp076 [Escherichia phage EP335]|jgi:hypothetical protein|uniref:Uncharacterized protein n=1 Tax=Escherichia phage EP335 TaxID=2070199 RepID=A0A2Z3DJH3_9CAUD|nr:hypothetical protein PQC40_gp076 [Escherichia phage EP335]AVZ45159.1 hypothetical protein [Escherichia phage EP335]
MSQYNVIFRTSTPDGQVQSMLIEADHFNRDGKAINFYRDDVLVGTFETDVICGVIKNFTA